MDPWRSSAQVYSPPDGKCICKVRHAEVVLVDDVSLYNGKYWLCLKWPGQKGGFAGYIAVYKNNMMIISAGNSNSNSHSRPNDNDIHDTFVTNATAGADNDDYDDDDDDEEHDHEHEHEMDSINGT